MINFMPNNGFGLALLTMITLGIGIGFVFFPEKPAGATFIASILLISLFLLGYKVFVVGI